MHRQSSEAMAQPNSIEWLESRKSSAGPPRSSVLGLRTRKRSRSSCASDQILQYLATPRGFEPPISTVTRWHVNRYTTGPPMVPGALFGPPEHLHSICEQVSRST